MILSKKWYLGYFEGRSSCCSTAAALLLASSTASVRLVASTWRDQLLHRFVDICCFSASLSKLKGFLHCCFLLCHLTTLLALHHSRGGYLGAECGGVATILSPVNAVLFSVLFRRHGTVRRMTAKTALTELLFGMFRG